MKRVCIVAFALAVFGLGGVVRAAEPSSAESLVVAQAQSPARPDDSIPATKGDIRRLEGDIHGLEGDIRRLDENIHQVEVRMVRLEERMDGQERELRELRLDLRQIRDTMQTNFLWLMAVIAVLGLPQLLSWVSRMRGNGRSATAAIGK